MRSGPARQEADHQRAMMSVLPVKQHPLPYAEQLERRETCGVDLLVIHCTELPDLMTAREHGEKIHYPGSGTGNSGHFYIDRDGSVEQWVPVERIAHHVVGFNQRSIGIELVNKGRYPHWLKSDAQQMHEQYPGRQINGLLGLLGLLCARYPELAWITGHEQLDTDQVSATDNPALSVYRKRDPGPRFPWEVILQAPALSGLLRRFQAPIDGGDITVIPS